MSQAFYGWYDDAAQPREQPTYDPPHDGPCLYCGRPIDPENDVRTHAIMPLEYAARSYFYRTHRSCDEAAKAAADPDGDDCSKPRNMDGVIFDMIARNGD